MSNWGRRNQDRGGWGQRNHWGGHQGENHGRGNWRGGHFPGGSNPPHRESRQNYANSSDGRGWHGYDGQRRPGNGGSGWHGHDGRPLRNESQERPPGNGGSGWNGHDSRPLRNEQERPPGNDAESNPYPSYVSFDETIRRIKAKDFDLLDFEEKLLEQLSKTTTSLGLERVPAEIKFLAPHEIEREKAKTAASFAIKEVLMEQKRRIGCHVQESSDSEGGNESGQEEADDDYPWDDDDDSPYAPQKKRTKGDPEYPFSKSEVAKFFNSLRKNIVFDMGFRVTGLQPDELTNCWCPCGKHMMPWRERFGLVDIVEKYDSSNCGKYKAGGKVTPLGLMGHLRSKQDSCILHYGIIKFLEDLYGDLRGTGHKALYQLGDANYRRADAAEKKEMVDFLTNAIQEKERAEAKAWELELELQKKERERNELKESLEATNKSQKDRMEELEANMKALHIKEDDKCPETKVSEESLCALMDAQLKCLMFGVPETKHPRIQIAVPQSLENPEFDINIVLNNEYEKKLDKKTKESSIFGKDDCLWKIVHKWKINFGAFNFADTLVKREDDAAFDSGGPTRQFFAQFWRHLHDINVVHVNETSQMEHKISLFHLSDSGVCPMADDNLLDCVHEAVKGERDHKDVISELLCKIDEYYCAVGVVIFQAIISRNPMAPNAMPRFWRNVLLKGWEPKDIDKYHKAQILEDLQNIGIQTKAYGIKNKSLGELVEMHCWELTETDDPMLLIDDENFFTVYLQRIMVERNSRAIKGLKKGITLDGQIDFTIFSLMPIDLLSRALFAKTGVTADDVLQILKMRAEEQSVGRKTVLVPLEQHQMAFFNGPVKETIRELSEEDLTKFVTFCTGYNYVPQDKPGAPKTFFIEVEFSLDSIGSLPVAHTCEKQIRLPRQAYGGDKLLFKTQLLKALAFTGSLMTMY